VTMRLTPDSAPDTEQQKCQIEGVVTTHAVWPMQAITQCENPLHKAAGEHPVSIVIARECASCGVWTEWVKVFGGTAATFEICFSPNEVKRFKAGLE